MEERNSEDAPDVSLDLDDQNDDLEAAMRDAVAAVEEVERGAEAPAARQADPPPAPAPESGPSAEEETAKLRQEIADLRDRSMRTLADFDNFRKRATRDVELAQKYAVERFAQELLPVMDGFELAQMIREGRDFVVVDARGRPRTVFEHLSAQDLDPVPGALHGHTYPLVPDLEGMMSPRFRPLLARLTRAPWEERARWLRVLGVQGLVLFRDPGVAALRPLDRVERYGVVTRLYAVADPAPAVWWPRRVEPVAADDEALRRVAALADPVAEVVVEGPPLPHTAGGKVRRLSATPDRIELEVTSGGGFRFADLDTPWFLAENPFEGGYVANGGMLSVAHIAAGHGVELKVEGQLLVQLDAEARRIRQMQPRPFHAQTAFHTPFATELRAVQVDKCHHVSMSDSEVRGGGHADDAFQHAADHHAAVRHVLELDVEEPEA